MTTYFRARTCVNCGQGQLVIMKDLSSQTLYLHCAECEWGWRDPATADRRSAGFLTLLEDFEAEPADALDIQAHDWGGHVVGTIDF